MSLNGCIDKILLNCRFGNLIQISEQKKGLFRMTMIDASLLYLQL